MTRPSGPRLAPLAASLFIVAAVLPASNGGGGSDTRSPEQRAIDGALGAIDPGGFKLEGTSPLDADKRGTYTVVPPPNLKITVPLTLASAPPCPSPPTAPPTPTLIVSPPVTLPPVSPSLPLSPSPCPTAGVTSVDIPVDVTVGWAVDPASDVQAGTNALSANILVRPDVTQPDEATEVDRTVRAFVTLRADPTKGSPKPPDTLATAIGTRSRTITLTLPIKQKTLQIPTVIAMFVDPNFTSAVDAGALIIVRGAGCSAGATGAGVAGVLTPFTPVLAGLTPVFPDLAPLAGAITRITTRVGSTGNPTRNQCVAASEINLVNVPLRPFDALRGIDHAIALTAEDSISSIVMVGRPGVTAHFFNDRADDGGSPFKFNKTGGEFTLTSDATMAINMSDLESPPGMNAPRVNPPGAFTEVCPPKSFVLTDPDVFANQLSAVGFAPVDTMQSSCPP